VWADPETPLFTLKMFLSANLLRTKSRSVPIPILLPIDIESGIDET
jgi:hypothetical protein